MIRVVAAIIESQHRLLICQRRRGSAFALKWEFPGGKMRGGETPWDALARELREELAMEARIGREIYRIRYRYAEVSEELELSFFFARLLVVNHAAAGRSTDYAFARGRNRMFERIQWVQRSELNRYDFLAADRGLVARLAAGEFRTPDGENANYSR